MAHAFAIIPAKPAFGNFSKKLNYSDIITNKRINTLYCECVNNDDSNYVNSQSQRMDFNKIKRTNCEDSCETFPFDKTNLEVNLITQLYLPQDNVLVIENKNNPGVPSKVDPSLQPYYAYYNVDPNNQLVGDTQCGIQKYINYMILDISAFLNTKCDDDSGRVFCDCSFFPSLAIPTTPIFVTPPQGELGQTDV